MGNSYENVGRFGKSPSGRFTKGCVSFQLKEGIYTGWGGFHYLINFLNYKSVGIPSGTLCVLRDAERRREHSTQSVERVPV